VTNRLRLLELAIIAIGAAAALVLVLVTVRLAAAYLDAEPVIGALLLIAAAPLVLVAYDLWSPLRRWGMWRLGAIACLGLVAVYLVGIAVGLPSAYDDAWRTEWALGGLALVLVYLAAATAWFWEARRELGPRQAGSLRLVDSWR
jgi:hypothetical protein